MDARDALGGPDGTQPERRTADPTVAPPPTSDVQLPGMTDPDAVARWMDADRERALRPTARDVPPPRPIPRPRTERVLPPEYVATSAVGASDAEESAWQRQRREDAEFRAQFGEWRARGPRPAGPTGGAARRPLGGVRLGAPLIVLIAVLIAVFALALHL